MTRAICIANQKGGVGKTTTAINLASTLARAGKHTLLVDLDPQCNATTGLGMTPVDHHPLLGSEPIRNQVLAADSERLDVLPGSRRFHDVEVLANSETVETRKILDHLRIGTKRYDYILIDCPPSLGQLTCTALSASDEIFMPIQCEYFAMEGLTQMIEVIRDIMHTKKHNLQFGGILLTMYDDSLELTREVDEEVREFFGEIVFETVIPRDVSVTEAPSYGKSVIDYSPRSRGTRAYIELCLEVLENDPT